jgi:hypothetical protein
VGQPHKDCAGTGWGHVDEHGYVDTGVPCSCNPNGDGKPPEPKKPGNPWVTVAVLDDDTAVRDPNEEGQGPEGLFSPSQIAARNAADLAAMARERKTKR